MKDFLKKLFKESESGFSLAEVMVAAGMMGVISLGLMQIMKTGTKQQKKISQDFTANNLLWEAQQTIRTAQGCANTLQGISLVGGFPQALPSGGFVNQSGSTIIAIGETYGKQTPGAVIVTAINVLGCTLPDDTVDSACAGAGTPGVSQSFTLKIGIDFRKRGNATHSFGSQTFTRRLNVNVIDADGDDNLIFSPAGTPPDSCQSDATGSAESACRALGGFYDTTISLCVNIDIQNDPTAPTANPNWAITSRGGLLITEDTAVYTDIPTSYLGHLVGPSNYVISSDSDSNTGNGVTANLLDFLLDGSLATFSGAVAFQKDSGTDLMTLTGNGSNWLFTSSVDDPVEFTNTSGGASNIDLIAGTLFTAEGLVKSETTSLIMSAPTAPGGTAVGNASINLNGSTGRINIRSHNSGADSLIYSYANEFIYSALNMTGASNAGAAATFHSDFTVGSVARSSGLDFNVYGEDFVVRNNGQAFSNVSPSTIGSTLATTNCEFVAGVGCDGKRLVTKEWVMNLLAGDLASNLTAGQRERIVNFILATSANGNYTQIRNSITTWAFQRVTPTLGASSIDCPATHVVTGVDWVESGTSVSLRVECTPITSIADPNCSGVGNCAMVYATTKLCSLNSNYCISRGRSANPTSCSRVRANYSTASNWGHYICPANKFVRGISIPNSQSSQGSFYVECCNANIMGN